MDDIEKLREALTELTAQARHLVDDLTWEPNPDDPGRRYIRPGAGMLFSNMVNALASYDLPAAEAALATSASPSVALTDERIAELIVEHKLMAVPWPTQRQLTAFARECRSSVPAGWLNARLTNCDIHPREGDNVLAGPLHLDRYLVTPLENPAAPSLGEGER